MHQLVPTSLKICGTTSLLSTIESTLTCLVIVGCVDLTKLQVHFVLAVDY